MKLQCKWTRRLLLAALMAVCVLAFSSCAILNFNNLFDALGNNDTSGEVNVPDDPGTSDTPNTPNNPNNPNNPDSPGDPGNPDTPAGPGNTPDHQHTVVIDNAVEPTCSSTGLTEGKHCSDCGAVITAQTVVPAKQHTVVIEAGVAATCMQTGLTEGRYCTVCDTVLAEQTVIPVQDHSVITDAAVSATCANTGLTEGKRCSVCKVVLVQQEISPVTTHTYSGKNDRSCNVCGYVRDAECAHATWEVILGRAETCASVGLTDGRKCLKCGELILAQTVIPVKPHTEVTDAAVDATCASTGLSAGKHCSVCNKVLAVQTVIPAKPHTEVTDAAVSATCTQTGLTAGKHCSVCNKVIVAQTVIPVKPHTEVIDAAVGATCTQTGLTAGKHCSACNKVIVAQTVINAFGHSYDNSVDTSCNNCGAERTVVYGLYDVNDDLIASWDTLVNEYGMDISKNYTATTYYGDKASPYVVLKKSALSDGVKLIIPEGATSIGDYAFYYCTDLTSIILPNSVTSIGNYTFYKCTALESIDIPKSVTSIGKDAFSDCASLESINFDGTKAQWNAISKGASWNDKTGSYTVYCADGNIVK